MTRTWTNWIWTLVQIQFVHEHVHELVQIRLTVNTVSCSWTYSQKKKNCEKNLNMFMTSSWTREQGIFSNLFMNKKSKTQMSWPRRSQVRSQVSGTPWPETWPDLRFSWNPWPETWPDLRFFWNPWPETVTWDLQVWVTVCFFIFPSFYFFSKLTRVNIYIFISIYHIYIYIHIYTYTYTHTHTHTHTVIPYIYIYIYVYTHCQPLLVVLPLCDIWKGDCIPFPNRIAHCISEVLVCDWRSLCLHTTLDQAHGSLSEYHLQKLSQTWLVSSSFL